jgi:predicted GNAT family N-acyltransferase
MKRKFGHHLIEASIGNGKTHFKVDEITISAQVYLKFYESRFSTNW